MTDTKKPDYDLIVKGKNDRYGSKVGAAWVNEKDGKKWIRIQINTGTAIIAGDHWISLFPSREFKKDDDSGDYDDSGF